MNLINSGAICNYGCATSTTKRWSVSTGMQTAADPSNTFRFHSNTNLYYIGSPSSGGLLHSADFNGWVTDGFQLDWTDAPSNTNRMISYLVINGGLWDCGNFTSPTTPTNNVDTAVSVSSKPLRGLIIASTNASAYDTLEDNAIFHYRCHRWDYNVMHGIDR